VSRTRKAALIAAFSYIQFGLAFVSGIVLVPTILRKVGTEHYGLWLACGELLAYSAMVDLGILGVLPWMIAQKDGEGDRRKIRELLGNAICVAALTGAAYLVVALTLWQFAARVVSLDDGQRGTLWGPLLVIVAGTSITFPMRTFNATLQALQDVVFGGVMGIISWAMNICLLLWLLSRGHGLYALAAAAVIPSIVTSLVCLLRLKLIAPDLISIPHVPSRADFFMLFRDGFGVWMGGIGWRMVAASSSLVIVAVASPGAAVIYACTTKLGDMLMQMAWQLGDSGLIGLAQLSGEGRHERVREVVLAMLRLFSVASGGVAYVVLGFNAAFVGLWVGADKFGGYALSALLATNVILLSVTHGLFVTGAVLGSRFQTGVATLLQGVLNIALAVILGRSFGLVGVAAACSLSTLLLAIPLGVKCLRRVTGLTGADLWRGVFASWGGRVAAMLCVGAALGHWLVAGAVWVVILAAPGMGLLYLWYMRSLYVGMPFPARVRPWLVKVRLLPNAGESM
jgi:O-antigen/teichoic acid export membrane protein